MNDLTCVYYTCNVIPESFASKLRSTLLEALGGLPLVSVSHRPLEYGQNVVVDLPRSHFSIYRQALIGAQVATTKYIALAEDDVLYSAEHFKHRPRGGHFEYNMGVWALYTWVKPALFSYKDRRNLSGLICERELFIEAMNERFGKYPEGARKEIWGEPGRYERQLGVTQRESGEFYTEPPNVVFSHETALSFSGLGKHKKLGHLRATEIPHWGRAEDVLKLYR